MSTDQDVDRFLQNPSIDQLKQNPTLIDRVGGRIGKLCVDNDFGEHQLRRVHERLLDLYYSSKRLASKPGAGVGLGKALDTELVRLKYFIAYQWSRFDYQRGRSYFEPFMKLVDQIKDFEAVEKLFYLSEAIIAYYNYHTTIKVSGRGGGVQRRGR